MVWGAGCQQGEGDGAAVEPRLRERHLCGGDGDVGQRLSVGSVTALLNAGATQNPAGLEAEALLDLGVGDAALGRVVAEADNGRSGGVAHALPSRAPGASAMAA
jgi:hypothetical protein